jgi:hypothetical protein
MTPTAADITARKSRMSIASLASSDLKNEEYL